MRIAVIGAGAVGLCAIKHAVSFGGEVIAFEQSNKIGWTWVYTDEIGKDKRGTVVHTSIYKALRNDVEANGLTQLSHMTMKVFCIFHQVTLWIINIRMPTSSIWSS